MGRKEALVTVFRYRDLSMKHWSQMTCIETAGTDISLVYISSVRCGPKIGQESQEHVDVSRPGDLGLGLHILTSSLRHSQDLANSAVYYYSNSWREMSGKTRNATCYSNGSMEDFWRGSSVAR